MKLLLILSFALSLTNQNYVVVTNRTDNAIEFIMYDNCKIVKKFYISAKYTKTASLWDKKLTDFSYSVDEGQTIEFFRSYHIRINK